MIFSSTRLFGILPDGSEVSSWTLRNRHGMEVEIMNYGAINRGNENPGWWSYLIQLIDDQMQLDLAAL